MFIVLHCINCRQHEISKQISFAYNNEYQVQEILVIVALAFKRIHLASLVLSK